MKLEHKADVLIAEITQILSIQRSNIDSIHLDRTTVRTIERANDLQKCGLPCSTGADNAHHFTFIDMQINAFEHLQRAETLGDSLNIDHLRDNYSSCG